MQICCNEESFFEWFNQEMESKDCIVCVTVYKQIEKHFLAWQQSVEQIFLQMNRMNQKVAHIAQKEEVTRRMRQHLKLFIEY